VKLRTRIADIPAAPVAEPTERARLARDEQVAIKAMTTPDVERERYVQDLMRRVADNSYNPTGMEIAEAFLADRIADQKVL